MRSADGSQFYALPAIRGRPDDVQGPKPSLRHRSPHILPDHAESDQLNTPNISATMVIVLIQAGTPVYPKRHHHRYRK